MLGAELEHRLVGAPRPRHANASAVAWAQLTVLHPSQVLTHLQHGALRWRSHMVVQHGRATQLGNGVHLGDKAEHSQGRRALGAAVRRKQRGGSNGGLAGRQDGAHQDALARAAGACDDVQSWRKVNHLLVHQRKVLQTPRAGVSAGTTRAAQDEHSYGGSAGVG